MKYIVGNTFADLYSKILTTVYNDFDFETSPRGQKVRECLNVVLELTNPTLTLFKTDDKELTMPTGYTKKELALYLMATDDACLFSKASKFWNFIKTEKNTVNSAYGNLIFNRSLADGRSQFDWAFDCLVKDKDSRQSFMRFNNTSHQYEGNKDVPCTFIQTFHIRNNKLYSTVEMRSNDIVTGTVHDISAFCLFMNLMYTRLLEVYPDLELGTYTHIVSSFHAYEKDFELIEKRINSTLNSAMFPFPMNWRVIKSNDIKQIVDIRLNNRNYAMLKQKIKSEFKFGPNVSQIYETGMYIDESDPNAYLVKADNGLVVTTSENKMFIWSEDTAEWLDASCFEFIELQYPENIPFYNWILS